MRKMLLSFCGLLFMTGVLVAGEVTLLRFDTESKELVVQEGESEKTYTITDKTKFSIMDKESGKLIPISYDDAVKGLGNPKSEGKLKFDIIVKDDEVVEAKLPGRKKKP